MGAYSKRVVPADWLLRFAQTILEAVGTPLDIAKIVSESLVQANLAGHDSHGAMRLPSYVELVRSSQIQPSARATVVNRLGGKAEIDGAWGWGQPAARLAVDNAVELASKNAVSAVTIRRCNHIGRLGEYVEKISASGMIGIAMCNAEPVVAPFGGRTRLLGTNPIAFAAPRSESEPPLMIDFATATVAEGKLRVARDSGDMISPGLIIDSEGRPSLDPRDFYLGGALLPFGGHKGYGLSMMAEILGGVLSGTGFSSSPEYRGGNGTIVVALDISAFLPLGAFVGQSHALSSTIKASPPVEGSREVLVPGEPEALARVSRQRYGVSLPGETWAALMELAQDLGVRVEALAS